MLSELDRDYRFEPLWSDGVLALARGYRLADSERVLLLAPELGRGSASTELQLAHAHALREQLDAGWAALPRALVRHRASTALLSADPGGQLLLEPVRSGLGLGAALRVAAGLCQALGRLHAAGLVHKDIKPANVLVDVTSGQAWLTGFGIAGAPGAEPAPLRGIDGTLAYMSPEQTGHLSRGVDARSDLYSLGVTLYELFSGALPFRAAEPSEWLTCHVAREPLPLDTHERRVPAALGQVVMKLLAKAPEDRYQSAAGVEADLRHCLAAWERAGEIAEFAPGSSELLPRLESEQLFGRQQPLRLLREAFARVQQQGNGPLLLVSGPSGIGKSALVGALRAELGPTIGYASSKLDAQQREVPYAALARACQGLVLQALARSDAEVAACRRALREALGQSGQLLVNLIPELEPLIGPQPPAPEAPGQDTQGLIQRLFVRLLGAFASAAQPLLLFLDDLQWLDAASLDWLGRRIDGGPVPHLLLIGAYRSSEVDAAHPLHALLLQGRAQQALLELQLEPLGPDDLKGLLQLSLDAPAESLRPLAALVHEQTAGNPFFLLQFLGALLEQGLLQRRPPRGEWHWDEARIRARGYTENVVELLLDKLGRLPAPTRELLRRMACLGSRASESALCAAAACSTLELGAALRPALAAGLCSRSADGYAFLHDRVQEAAYALWPEAERAHAHAELGLRLLERATGASDEPAGADLFDVVGQLNRGLSALAPELRRPVAELELRAAQRAKAGAAYASAAAYLAVGLGLLDASSWDDAPELMLALTLGQAECALLAGELDAPRAQLEQLLARPLQPTQRAACRRLLVVLHVLRSDYPTAVEHALAGLSELGIQLSAHPPRAQLDTALEALRGQLAGRAIDELDRIGRCQSPEVEAAMGVLSELFAPACFTDEVLASLHLCQMVSLTLQHGITPASAHGFAWFGIMLGHVFERYEEGHRFAETARAVVARHGFAAYEAKALFSLELTSLWARPLPVAIEVIRAAFGAGVECGDVAIACFACHHLVSDRLVLGAPLEEVLADTRRGLEFAQGARFSDVVEELRDQQQFIERLRDPGLFQPCSAAEDAARALAQSASPRMPTMYFWHWVFEAQARFLYADLAGALRALGHARSLAWSSPVHIQTLNYRLFAALTLAALAGDESPLVDVAQARAELGEHLRKLELWERVNPATFSDKRLLVQAELLRLEGRELEALAAYEAAIASARDSGFVAYEALASEVASRFAGRRGLEVARRAYLRNAKSCYERWGARGKVQQLTRSHPFLADERPSPWMTIGASPDQLDLATVIAASQAVSGEIVLERLLETLMTTLVEHAGATRGVLILPHGDELRIEAEAIASERPDVRLRPERVSSERVPESVLRFVIRTRESVLLEDARTPNAFSTDPYLAGRRVRSLSCLPLVRQARLIGVLYIENQLTPHAFTARRMAVLRLLASQAAISLENARLYANLEHENRDRRRAEAELASAFREMSQLKERFQLALDALPGFVWTAQPDGHVDYLNQRWLDFTRIPLEQAVGWGWQASIVEEDRPQLFGLWRQMLATASFGETTARMLDSAGVPRWFLFRGVPLCDEQGRLSKWIGQITDIDDQRRAETRLAREKELLDQIARSSELTPILDALCRFVDTTWPGSMSLVFLCDAEGKRLYWKGTTTSLPPSFVAAIDGCEVGMTGPCPSAAQRGEPMIISDIAAEVTMLEFVELCASHDMRSVWSTPIFSKDGGVLGTLAVYSRRCGTPNAEQRDLMAQLCNLASIAIERAQADAALRRSEMYLQNAQRLSRTGSFGWRLPDNRLTWSDETYRIYGLEPQSPVDLDAVFARVHPDDLGHVRAVLEPALAEQCDFELYNRLLLPDGQLKHVHVVAHAVRDAHGRLSEFIGSVNDISERKREEERLQSALLEREALLKEVHHRVKNNLQLISSLLNLQASRAPDPAVADLFADSRNRVRSMALVHENLYRAGSFAKVDMKAHIENLCAHLSRAYGLSSRHVELRLDVSDLRLELDAAISCGLIINELVSNALEHAFPRGAPGRLEVGLREASAGRYLLTVSDDGVGLPAGLELGAPSSLGLSLVNDLTAQLHGALRVEREHGTRFCIEFAEPARPERRP